MLRSRSVSTPCSHGHSMHAACPWKRPSRTSLSCPSSSSSAPCLDTGQLGPARRASASVRSRRRECEGGRSCCQSLSRLSLFRSVCNLNEQRVAVSDVNLRSALRRPLLTLCTWAVARVSRRFDWAPIRDKGTRWSFAKHASCHTRSSSQKFRNQLALSLLYIYPLSNVLKVCTSGNDCR